jgi:uncharacterized membrane protein HdeD (DUF308 family)
MSEVTISTFERSHWWVLLITGILSILFGIAVFVWPGISLLILVYLFGAYILVDGILAIIASFQERKTNSGWWWLLIGGIAGVIVSFIVFFWPGVTSLLMFYFIAAWAFITGIFEIVSGFMQKAWLLVLAGALSVILGIIFFAHPVAGILSILWLLAAFAIVSGIVQIVHAFQIRSA